MPGWIGSHDASVIGSAWAVEHEVGVVLDERQHHAVAGSLEQRGRRRP